MFFPLKINNIKRYLKTDGFESTFIIFPQDLSNNDVIKYEYIDYHGSCTIVLIVRYEDAKFNDELQRISLITNNEKKIIYDMNELFTYPTYYSMYSYEQKFEYASINYERNEIVYIYFDNVTPPKINFDLEYLPKEFQTFSDEILESDYQYSIY